MHSVVEAVIPLKDSQLLIWMSILKKPELNKYNELIGIKVYGNKLYDDGIIEKSIVILSEKIAALRSIVTWNKTKVPYIIVYQRPFVNYISIDGSAFFNRNWYDSFIEEKWKEEVKIDVVPFYFYIIKENETYSHILLKFSHILVDGWSTTIILEELYTILYNMIRKEKYSTKKFEYENKVNSSKDENRNRLFWKQYLNDFTKSDFDVKEGEVSFWNSHFNWKASSLSQFSLAVYIYASWILNEYISRNNKNVQFGMMVSGREVNTELLEKVGFYMKTLPFFISLDLSWTINELLQKVNKLLLDIITHSDISINEIHKINNSRCVYNKVIVIQNYFSNLLNFDNEELKFELETKKYDNDVDLCLAVRVFESDIYLDINYNPKKYQEEKIKKSVATMKKIFFLVTDSKLESEQLFDILVN